MQILRIQGVGQKTLQKVGRCLVIHSPLESCPPRTQIKEIVATGKLQRLDHLITGVSLCVYKPPQSHFQRSLIISAAETTAIAVFLEIWGVGPATADKLAKRGYRTLEDLRAHQDELTVSQRIGLRYYEEFQLRIPREEVEQVARIVSHMSQ
jgi:DNA polymerase lambda